MFIKCKTLNILLVFITQSYFSVPKDVRLNSTHYLILKINNTRELQSIVTNHSAEIDYQDFFNIYKECTEEPYFFLTIDTKLPASKKIFFWMFIKMTLTDELKILDNKIKENQAQYDLGRDVAKISALSSKELLEKNKYLTGEYLGHRPSALEKTKFEYSPLGMSLSKSFKKDNVENIAKSESDFNYDGKYRFFKFYKGYDELEEMSLDSKYYKNFLLTLKILDRKTRKCNSKKR